MPSSFVVSQYETTGRPRERGLSKLAKRLRNRSWCRINSSSIETEKEAENGRKEEKRAWE